MIKLQTRLVVAYADLSGYAMLTSAAWNDPIKKVDVPTGSCYAKEGETAEQVLARFDAAAQKRWASEMARQRKQAKSITAYLARLKLAGKALDQPTLNHQRICKNWLRRLQRQGPKPTPNLVVLEVPAAHVVYGSVVPVAKKGKK